MASDNKYNGWANYETWVIKLWLDNEQYTQELWHDRAVELLNDDAESYKQRVLAEEIRDYTYAINPLINNASVYSDLLQSAIDAADFYEIAGAYLEDARSVLEND